jgi:signal transduction histidine kinase
VRAAEGRLLDARKQLATSERLAALGELAARAASEARNPLAAIGGFARRIQRELPEDDPHKDLVEVVVREADRLERILAEQVSFVRVSRPTLGMTDLNHLLGGALGELSEPVLKKRVKLLKRLGADLPPLLLDGEKIRLVVTNMLANALEQSPAGGRLRVETRRAQGYVVVEIGSDGPPLSGEMLERLFVPFAAARESTEGVGLALAQQVVQSHGGEIRVRSEGDWGLVFSFTLPIHENRDRRRPRGDRRNRFPAA